MAIKHAVIKNKLYEVYDASENYVPEIMDNNYSAILMPDGIVYPKVAKSSHAVGYYQQGPFLIFNKPKGEDKKNYSYNDIKHLDFSDAKSIKEVLDNKKKFEKLESSVLESPDKIFRPIIKQDDLPEMVGLKQAVTLKHIDKDKYAHRFGDNYNNDMRLFDKHTISMPKLKSMAENFDMDVYMVFKDKDKNVPNPMKKTIKVKLTNIDDDSSIKEE